MPQARPCFSQSGTKQVMPVGASMPPKSMGVSVASEAAIASSSPAAIPIAVSVTRLASSETRTVSPVSER